MRYHLIGIYHQLKQEMEQQKDQMDRDERSNIAGVGAVALESAKNLEYNSSQLYNTNWGGKGHGIAAEVGNTMIDKTLLRDAKQVGGDNAKNGADRIVNGQEIQSKYCNTPSNSVKEAFYNHQYRYYDKNGNPMQLEVPADQYDEAVKLMEKRILNGEINGVSDPNKAKNIVRKGHLTYEQAANMTKAFTAESLTFDVAQGARMGAIAGGIGAGISVAQSIIKGDNIKTTAKNAAKVGGKAVIQTTTTSVITNQAMRSALGKVANKNVVTAVVTTSILTTGDVYKSFTGEQSFKQTGKNFVKNGAGVGGGMAGAAVGASLGSVIPVAGTFVGGLIGGVIGAMAATKVADEVMTNWLDIKDDIDEMIDLLNVVFQKLQEAYQLDEFESEMFKKVMEQSDLKAITQAFIKENNKEHFCVSLIEPLSVEMVCDRMDTFFLNPRDFYLAFEDERLA